jgi:hypothetical protein
MSDGRTMTVREQDTRVVRVDFEGNGVKNETKFTTVPAAYTGRRCGARDPRQHLQDDCRVGLRRPHPESSRQG